MSGHNLMASKSDQRSIVERTQRITLRRKRYKSCRWSSQSCHSFPLITNTFTFIHILLLTHFPQSLDSLLLLLLNFPSLLSSFIILPRLSSTLKTQDAVHYLHHCARRLPHGCRGCCQACHVRSRPGLWYQPCWYWLGSASSDSVCLHGRGLQGGG